MLSSWSWVSSLSPATTTTEMPWYRVRFRGASFFSDFCHSVFVFFVTERYLEVPNVFFNLND
jgi:hypothetical protein